MRSRSCFGGLISPNAIEVPPVGHSLEFALARVFEREAAAGGQVLNRLGCEDLAWFGLGARPGSYHDAQPTDLAVDSLTLAGVHAGAKFYPQGWTASMM